MEIKVVKNILAANESIAEENSLKFRKNKVFVINLIGFPGGGKTSIIKKTIEKLRSTHRLCL